MTQSARQVVVESDGVASCSLRAGMMGLAEVEKGYSHQMAAPELNQMCEQPNSALSQAGGEWTGIRRVDACCCVYPTRTARVGDDVQTGKGHALSEPICGGELSFCSSKSACLASLRQTGKASESRRPDGERLVL